MVNPLFIKNATVSIDGVEFGDAISNVTFTPTTSTLSFKGVSGAVAQSTGSEVWTVAFTYAQDFTDANTLAVKLFNDAGQTVTAVFQPEGEATTSITAQVTLMAGAFGGAVDAVAEATVTLPVSGRPVIVVPTGV